jgi:UDP-2,4-diacetamido-2,4,6-trideoxy-beta-L-altropyranose hydrolase
MARVLFRADGGSSIGMGHLVRSFALAQMLADRFTIGFFCKNAPGAFLTDLAKSGIGATSIEEDASFLQIIDNEDIVVLDGYHFDTAYQKSVKEKAHALVCIDDTHQGHFLADAIINPALGVQPSDYSAAICTRFLFGPDYALLRPPFLEAARRPSLAKEDALIVCFGGADPNNDTLEALRFLEKAPLFSTYYVVIGAAFRYKNALEAFIQETPLNVILLSNLDADKMVCYMQKSLAALTSPSSVAYEYLSVGGHLFLKIIVDNQRYMYENLIAMGCAADMHELLDFRKSKAWPVQIIDGKQNERFRRLFGQLLCGLRKATIADARLYWEWANDADVRAQSFDSRPIEWETHERWFAAKVQDLQTVLYVAEKEGEPFGQVRFQLENDQATISFSLDKAYRGQGLGGWMLERAMCIFASERPGRTSFVGLVKHGNFSSQKVFDKLGFLIKDLGHSLEYRLEK